MTINAATLAQMIRAAGIHPGSLPAEWECSKRVAEQWQTSKQPPFKAEDYAARQLEQMAHHVKKLLAIIYDAGTTTVLLRSFQPDDFVAFYEEDTPWTGGQYNRAIQHVLLMEEMGSFDADIMVIPDHKWPGADHEHILVLEPDTPLFAVAHRFPDQARIDLCVPVRDESSPGVRSVEDLTAVETLQPPLPLPEDQLTNSGLWAPRAFWEYLDASMVTAQTDWRVSGAGYPVSITSILPDEMSIHIRPVD